MSDQNKLSALSTPADVEPVAWLHPTANWSHVDYDRVRMHCGNGGPLPVPLYAAPVADTGPVSVPEGWVLVQQAALDWLFGEGPDPAGFHFGDWPEDIPRPQGAFWWRSVFRQILAAAPQPNPSTVDADAVIERLTKALNLAADRLDAASHRVGDHDSRAAFGIAQWAIDARAALAAQGEKP